MKSVDYEGDRFKKAKKIHISDYEGMMLYSSSHPDGCCLKDCFLEWYHEGGSAMEYAWATKPEYLPPFSVDGEIENILSDSFDDARSYIDENSVLKLKQAAREFDEANRHVITYRPDYSTAVLLKGKV